MDPKVCLGAPKDLRPTTSSSPDSLDTPHSIYLQETRLGLQVNMLTYQLILAADVHVAHGCA